MTRTAQLLALAEAATPGPWRKTCHGVVVADKGTGNTDDDYIVMWDDTPEHVETDATFIAATNPETTKQLVELVRLQHEALRSCGEGGSRLSHHRAQWFNAEEVDEAIEAFNKWENEE